MTSKPITHGAADSTPTVVLFLDKLGGPYSGRPRAVLQRASMLVDAGIRVVLVVERFSPRGEQEQLRLTGEGMLDSRVEVVFFTAAAAHLWRKDRVTDDIVPPIPHGTEASVTRKVGGKPKVTEYLRDGTALRTDRQRPDGRWERVEILDPQADLRQVWRYDDAGQLQVIEDQSLADGHPLRRQHVTGGNHVWLDIEMNGSLLHSKARVDHGPTEPYAAVVARWLDQTFAEVRKLVVIADGTSTSQEALRRMTLPHVRGVSVLHNTHLSGDAEVSTATPVAGPVDDYWSELLDDERNVHSVVVLTQAQERDLRLVYPDLPYRVIAHPAPQARRPFVRRRSSVVVSLGRLAPQKRLDHLILAFAQVVKSRPEARLELYGEGPERVALEALVEEHGVAEHVTFKGQTDDARAAFASAHATVLSSMSEGFPLVLGEAMGVGTPFVAYDIRYGPSDAIRDGVDGYLVPPGDIAALAERIVELLSNRRKARSMGRRAREYTKRFSYRSISRSWVLVVEDVLTSPA